MHRQKRSMQADTPITPPPPLLKLERIHKTFPYGKKLLHALHDINLTLLKGETLGLAGESGCGKSTLGKVALGLEAPTSGRLSFEGQELSSLSGSARRALRCKLQLVFQDPYGSLNPRLTIEQIIGEGIDIHRLAEGDARRHKILSLLTAMGLEAAMLPRYPHEFSGGQRQRIAIARALAVDPQLLVCDEPLSALDACTQSQVMALLLQLKEERKLTYLFISHDLHAMRRIADTIAVMYLGHIVEMAPTQRLFTAPKHPYTQALLSSIPIPDPVLEKKRSRLILQGELPSPLQPPSGCPFHPRCPKAMPICRQQKPELVAISSSSPKHLAACHFVA